MNEQRRVQQSRDRKGAELRGRTDNVLNERRMIDCCGAGYLPLRYYSRNHSLTVAALLFVAPLLGCASLRADLGSTAGAGALFQQFRVYDAAGRETSLNAALGRAARADVLFFGEEPDDAVCNQLEAQLLYSLIDQGKQPALSMEFFEADQQATLDEYLAGKRAEADFTKATRRNRTYVSSHRPLIELCRAAGMPVLAANAPRELIRAMRKSGKSYAEYRASLPPEKQAWLPAEEFQLQGSYRERFAEAMKGHGTDGPTSQPASAPDPAMVDAMYRGQLMWDNAMATHISNFRATHSNRPVMHIVGRFHVEQNGGTLARFRQLRPNDRVLTIVYQGSEEFTDLKFDNELRDCADFVIIGAKAREKRE